ncbi:hypothetical protein [Proteus columbae]|uniref:hypothetical protein n=1 Tax=Proteus columbae TaxID=1987580 RepID=UPI000C1E6618|nr:hypothetical protein [Proteus columbae]
MGLAGFTGWTRTDQNLHSNVQLNAGSAYLGSKIAGENSKTVVVSATFGATSGYGLTAVIELVITIEITNTEIQEEIKYFNKQKREKDNEPKN